MSDRPNYVSVTVSDGTSMGAFTATPSGNGPFPGLMLFQEAFGVNGYIRKLAERYAGEGYVVIAPELYHRTAQGFEADYSDFPSIAPHMQAVTNEGLQADIQAAWD